MELIWMGIVSCKTMTLKHTCVMLQTSWLITTSIGGKPHPPESPDLNLIENLQHKLKKFLRREIKSKTKDQLVDEIQIFQSTVSVDKCRKYISHLRKVIPCVIELDGATIRIV